VPGGWQNDAHTDKIHNFIDATSALTKNEDIYFIK